MTKPVRASRIWFVLGAIALPALALLAYAPTLGPYAGHARAGFTWDDKFWLWENPVITNDGDIVDYWLARQKTPDYLPLTATAFHLQWLAWGEHPRGYHAVNIVLHAFGALCLWRVLAALKIPGAWWAAAIFLVHPVTAASVGWITELKNVLSLALYLPAVWMYLRFDEKRRWRWYGLALATFALALTAKSSVVILPVALLGCVWWRRKTVAIRDLLLSAPFFALAAVSSVLTIFTQNKWGLADANVDPPTWFPESLALAGKAVWFYLYKAILPVNLSMIYPKWDIHTLGVLSFVPLALAMLAVAILIRRRNGWGRPLAFALGYYVLGLLPILGVFRMSYMAHSYVADHWHYVSLPAIIALIVGLAFHAGGRLRPPLRWIPIALAIAVVAASTLATRARAALFADDLALWTDTVARNPDSISARYNLGVRCLQSGRDDQAITLLQDVLALRPAHAKARRELAGLLYKRGRQVEKQAQPAQAAADFAKAVELDPSQWAYHLYYGMALYNDRQYAPAAEQFRMAIRLNPRHVPTHTNLGSALLQMNEPAQAVAAYRKAMEIDPDYAPARKNLRLAQQRLRQNRQP